MDTNENTNQEKNPLNELEEKVIENRTDSPKSRQKRKNIINIISIIIGVVPSIILITLLLALNILTGWDHYPRDYPPLVRFLLGIVISVLIGVVFCLISRWAITIVVGLFVKNNIILRVRVIFGLLLLFIVWGIRGHPLSSGHLLLQYSLGRRDFGGIECNGCDLRFANLEEVDLRSTNLREANLSGANLLSANLFNADLSGADLRNADLSGADLWGTDLSGVDLSGFDLSGVRLEHADLSGADLSGAVLSGANLLGADLSGADLSGADLNGANLLVADLSGADLRNADLSNADLSRADLGGADLSGARMVWADLSGANVFVSDLSNVDNLYCATMPNGMTYDGHLNLRGDLDRAKNIKNIDINDDEAMAEFYCISVEEYIRGQERNGSD